MKPGNESAPAGGTVAGREKASSNPKSTPAARPRKWRRILRILADGTKLTRFDAALAGDTVLNSTVCRIEQAGVRVERRWIEVMGRFGAKTHCCEYWLEPGQIERARRVLAEP